MQAALGVAFFGKAGEQAGLSGGSVRVMKKGKRAESPPKQQSEGGLARGMRSGARGVAGCPRSKG